MKEIILKAWANLSRVDLRESDLYGANLSWANLNRANLYRANLSKANLTKANLYRANLTKANLSGANLSGANLSGANLSGADLTRTRGLPLNPVPGLRALVAEKIKAEPELYDQTSFGSGSPEDCGTACCVAGWACRLGGGTQGLRVPTAATMLLWQDGKPMPSFSATTDKLTVLAALES